MSTAPTVLQQVQQHFPHLGIELPAGLKAALVDAASRQVKQKQALRFDPNDLTDAVRTAIEHGTDPATNKAVLTALARRDLATVLPELNGAAERARQDAVIEYAPDLIEAMRPVVEQASADIQAAAEAIPNLDLLDIRSAGHLRPELMTMWGRAREALARAERVGGLTSLIFTMLGLGFSNDVAPLMLADLTAEQLDSLPLGTRGRTPHAAALAALPLDLATPTTYPERVQRVREERQEQQRQTAEQGRRQHPSLLPISTPAA